MMHTDPIFDAIEAVNIFHNINEASIQASTGSVGNYYDNAIPETTNGLFKTKIIRRNGP